MFSAGGGMGPSATTVYKKLHGIDVGREMEHELRSLHVLAEMSGVLFFIKTCHHVCEGKSLNHLSSCCC